MHFKDADKKTRYGVSRSVSAIIAVVVIVVIAVGAYYVLTPSTPTSTTPSGGGATGAYDQDVIACAQKEATITIYGLADTPDFNSKVAPAFTKIFPWATVNYLGLSTGDLTNKVLAEHKAGQPAGDMILNVFVQTVSTLNQSGAIQKYLNPMIDKVGYPAYLKDSNNLYSPYTFYPSAVAYNTHVVTDTSKLPKTWVQFFTDPTWKGKLGYQKPTALGSTAGFLYMISKNMTNAQWIAFLKQAAANQPTLTDSQSASFTAMSTGELALAVGAFNDVVGAQQKNSSIAVDWINPVFAQRLVTAIVAGSPHQCMAKLFSEFSVTMDGQLAIGATGRVPALQVAANQSPILHTPSGVTTLPTDEPAFLNNLTYYGNTFKQIFGA